MRKGNMAKFLQNDTAMAALLGTDNAVLVWATRDRYWGASCSLWSDDVKKLTFIGQNKMGKFLMDLRTQFSD